MSAVQQFKNILINDLEEQGFMAVPSVLERIENAHFEYDKIQYATLRNRALEPLALLSPNDYLAQLKIFIGTLKGDANIDIKIRYRLPLRPNFFLGREDILLDIHNRLTGQTQPDPVVLLTGIGGMGKTTVMQEYLNRPLCQHHFNSIAVVAVNKNLQQAFVTGAATALGLNEQIKTIVQPERQLDYVLHAMAAQKGNNLFVIDNINESDIDDLRGMQKHFRASGWKFLVTTRTAPDEFVGKITLEELHNEEALVLFAYHYAPDSIPLNNNKENVEVYIESSGIRKSALELLEHILRHTLLTELLAKSGKQKGYTPEKILQSLKDEDFRHPGLQRTIVTGEHAKNTFREELSKATLDVYLMNLFETAYLVTPTGNPGKDREHEAIATMLRFFSVLPAHEMPIEDLKKLWRVDEPEENIFENRLDEVKQIGWIQEKRIKPEPDNELAIALMLKELTQNLLYKMHPLVQEVVYRKLKPDVVTVEPLIITITEILSNTLQYPQRFQRYAQAISDNLEFLYEED